MCQKLKIYQLKHLEGSIDLILAESKMDAFDVLAKNYCGNTGTVQMLAKEFGWLVSPTLKEISTEEAMVLKINEDGNMISIKSATEKYNYRHVFASTNS